MRHFPSVVELKRTVFVEEVHLLSIGEKSGSRSGRVRERPNLTSSNLDPKHSKLLPNDI